MNRFANTKKDKSFLYRLILPIAVFIGILLIFMNTVRGMEDGNVRQQKDALTNALNKSIVHCYATEGFYPPSLQFIKDHYQVTYNEEMFYVDYQPLGSNMLPDVTIISLAG